MKDATRKLLLLADDLLADPERWTQHACARTMEGTAVPSADEQACAFCAIGALEKAAWLTFPSGPCGHGEPLGVYSPPYLNALSELRKACSAFQVDEGDSRAITRINDGPDPVLAYQKVREIYARALGIE